MPLQVVKALGLIKKSAARVNLGFGILDKKLGDAIIAAAGVT
jgi:fumarate hydratase class II